MTTNINLSPQLENIVRQKIASGKYASVNEVVSEALRLLDERDQIDSLRLENLRKDIHDGVNSGDSVTWNSADIKKAGRNLLSERSIQGN
ncbi:MAG TPA: type II toxin-antitoxin system ParD family antitoxin [Ktedonobacteraceae bacterium]|nr:type II toxin-antitoxin system ParD family antitoxin [Ktedonobacteraceae bacterium]